MGEKKKNAPSLCPQCGGPVACGIAEGKETCWCMAYPAKLPVSAKRDAACLCEACLARLVLSKGDAERGVWQYAPTRTLKKIK